MWNGLDSTKEHMYTSGWPQEMRERGISMLMVDCPGSGEALRFQDLKSRVETEDWAKACVDYLETRDDVDTRPDRPGRLVAGRLLLPARRGVREAVQARRRLGRQPQLGRGAEEAPRARGREPGAALLGARALGVGLRRHRHVHRGRRGRQPQRRRRADHRPVPDHPRRERPADLGRLRPPVLRPGGQQPQARAADLHASRRARPSTSASTTCRTSARSPRTGSRTRFNELA